MEPKIRDSASPVALQVALQLARSGASLADDADGDLLTYASIRQQRPGSVTTGAGLIERAALKTDRTGAPYAALTIRCVDGATVEARWWRFPHPAEHCPAPGSVWRMSGVVDLYQGVPQLRLTSAEPAPSIDVAPFARSTRRSVDDLRSDVELIIAELGDDLARLARAVLSGEVYERFCVWPAAQSHHGAVRHGLLAHSIRVVRLAQHLAAAYGPDTLPHDGELVIAAALLHDVGKVWTLPAVAGAALPEEAQQVDHVTMGLLMLHAAASQCQPPLPAARLRALAHAVLAHHGMREWGAPVEPHSVEAWLVHLADLAEARLWEWSEEAEKVRS